MENKFSQLKDDKYEELLKRNTTKSLMTSNEMMLLKHGLIPLNYSENNDSYISSGYFAQAYHVLYKGKHVVAKITSTFGNFDASLKLYGLKDSLGEQEKHIMKIYDFIQENNCEILVCEKLNEIDVHIKNYIFDSPMKIQIHPKTNKNFYDDIDEINNFRFNNQIKSIYTGLNLLQDKHFVEKNFKDENLTEIFKEIIDNKFKAYLIHLMNNKNNYSMDEKSNFKLNEDVYKIFAKELKEKIKSNVTYNFIVNKLKLLFLEISNTNFPITKFPLSNVDKFKEKQKQHIGEEDIIFSETESLLICLEKLKKLGISHKDLNSNNIMERDDKTLVISDPGEFEFAN